MTARQQPPEKRIPTIPPHIEFPDPTQRANQEPILHPTKEEVAATLNRIRQQEKLSEELERIEADLQEIAHLVALNRHLMDAWREAHLERSRARDYERRTVKRWEEKIPEGCARRDMLTRFTEVVARVGFADEAAARLQCSTKSPVFLDRFFYDLKRILDRTGTRRPYRYMAAITNLFNFHAEDQCGAQRRARRCQKLGDTTRLCKNRQIFTCPHHDKVRDKIRKRLRRIGTKVPTARYPR